MYNGLQRKGSTLGKNGSDFFSLGSAKIADLLNLENTIYHNENIYLEFAKPFSPRGSKMSKKLSTWFMDDPSIQILN